MVFVGLLILKRESKVGDYYERNTTSAVDPVDPVDVDDRVSK